MGTIDILPTLAELAGSGLPEQKIDGKSVWPLLRGDMARVLDLAREGLASAEHAAFVQSLEAARRP